MSLREHVYILGAGGHARVIAEIIRLQGHTLAGFLDDNPALHGQTLMDVPIVGPISQWNDIECDGLVIAIGHNITRARIAQSVVGLDFDRWLTVIHPSAVISPSASVQAGSVIMAGAILSTQSFVAEHAIINTGATVDHDCWVGEYAHLAPGVHLGGGVIVESGAFVGIGASVLPGLTIEEWSQVGAGACVTKSVQSRMTVVGVPARPLLKES